ncbi:methyltransferase domain-containing protein [Paenibacillus piri]|uniref:Class I SAM-dependent methyltransferase n=1 Tax=Paenibacillus piri TaxID=2547395 RepID=A0A4R5KK64_9BACL|nr:methyltransferase domain-containing protein [Paenibacillus piri]TDF95836.1 class I SAM-dependent methyltransferase [Paenibacillus piri]
MSKRGYEQLGVAMTCRSFAEYVKMFALEELDSRQGPVLDVAAGASSFTAEANAKGLQAYAADPMYAMNEERIFAHGLNEIEVSTAKLAALRDIFDWSYYGTLEHHREMREQSLSRFIDDYRQHREKGRYVESGLPQLPFADNTFSLVLCSHFLFLYNEQFDYEFHLHAVRELLRVCRPGGQVRLYPLKSLQWDYYPHMDRLLEALKSEAKCQFMESRLPFIPGSGELLSLVKQGNRRDVDNF